MGKSISKEIILALAHSKQGIVVLAFQAATLYRRLQDEASRRYSLISLTSYEASNNASLVSIGNLPREFG